MKELDDFTVERLTTLSVSENLPEVAALARIALAAKTSQPVQWWTGPEPTPTGEMEGFHDHETGSHCIPLIPALGSANSPEIPDGWVACSERVPNKGQCVSITDGVLVGVWRYRGWWPDFDGNGCASTSDPKLLIKNITHWMPLPAAPKPEK